MSIKIRQQAWDRAATEMASDLTADAAAEALRARGHDVEVIDGDWGSSYLADEDHEHWEVQNLQSSN
jgi:hypothetical protein